MTCWVVSFETVAVSIILLSLARAVLACAPLLAGGDLVTVGLALGLLVVFGLVGFLFCFIPGVV